MTTVPLDRAVRFQGGDFAADIPTGADNDSL